MKRRNADRMGNFFMGLGLVVMIGGAERSNTSEVPWGRVRMSSTFMIGTRRIER